MGSAMMKHEWFTIRRKSAQRGFTLIEVMISIVILSIGLLALVAAFGAALAATQKAQSDLIARQKATQTMESIYTARETGEITFNQIANVSAGGIFVDGAKPMLCAGPDGLIGTADDGPCTNPQTGAACPNGGVECLTLPGPDGIMGTADDQLISLANYTRTITIANVLNPDGTVNPNLRQLTVTATYTQPGTKTERTYTANALISAFR